MLQHTVQPHKNLCTICSIQFETAEERIKHFKSEYHIFNSKRRAVLLEPVSKEKFEEIQKQEKTQEVIENKMYYCTLCKKRYFSKNQMIQHENSNKHKTNMRKNPEKSNECIKEEEIKEKDEEEEMTEQTLDEIIEERKQKSPKTSGKHCLFCGNEHKTIEENLEHMEKEHSFFIPNVECCCDIEGLINYLHEKICIGYFCIWCSHDEKSFQNEEAVRHHMRDMCHCKMIYEEENMDEYDEWYDYSSNPEPIRIVRMDETSMTLSNGMTIGNRSMSLYYKQNIRPVETREIVLSNQNKEHRLPNMESTQNIHNKAVINIPEKNYIDYARENLRKQLNNVKVQRNNQDRLRQWTKLGIKYNKFFIPREDMRSLM